MTLKKVKPLTPEDYRNNRIVTAERMAEIDKQLAEILPKLKDGQITPGRPGSGLTFRKRSSSSQLLVRPTGFEPASPPFRKGRSSS